MNELEEMVFLGEIALQIKIAQRADERLKVARDIFDNTELWCSIQSILVTAGNVSKILWPTDKKYNKRGERLRQLLKVEKDNPLSNRKFRNHFEHYDERIEDSFINNPSAVYVDLAMNPSLIKSSFSNAHRGYNSFNNTLIFRGETLHLDEILKALEKLHLECKQYIIT